MGSSEEATSSYRIINLPQGPRRALLSREAPRLAGKCLAAAAAAADGDDGGYKLMLTELTTCSRSRMDVCAARRSARCALVSSRLHALTNSRVVSTRQRLRVVSRGFPSPSIARAAFSPAFAPRVVLASASNAAGRTIWQEHTSWCRSALRLDPYVVLMNVGGKKRNPRLNEVA